MELDKTIINECIEKNMDEAVQTLKSLISINSVGGDPVTVRIPNQGTSNQGQAPFGEISEQGQAPFGGAAPAESKTEVYPFGQGVQDVFECALAKGGELGFDTCDVDHYGGHIEWKGVKPADEPEAGESSEPADEPGASETSEAGESSEPANETLGVLAHLDTVPEGEGWEHGPFSGDIADGCIWGRGSIDDKGPLVAVLYAMKSLKDAGYVPAKNIRLILGLDEETNWDGMEYYFDHMPRPDFGFTPDADFPVLNGEKGIMSFKIAAKLKRDTVKGLELRKMSGGTAVNMVPAQARAVVHDQDAAVYDRIRKMAESYEMTTGHALGLHKMGKSLEITAKGKSAHGSMPEQGINAVSILIGFLGQLNFVNEDLCRFFDFYNDCIGMTTDGSKLGIAMSDEPSGRLTLNPGILEYDGQAVSVKCDVRYPVTKTSDDVYDGMMPAIDKYGLGVLKSEDREPIYLDPDSPLIKTFMSCYQDATGDMEHGPIVIGGGTYSRTSKNIVAFGAMFPGDPQLEHQPNERLPLERFRQLVHIYAEAIYRLTQPGFTI